MSCSSLSPLPGEVAVLIPCYNEEKTIAAVVRSFREALPAATVYVYDNNSRDASREQARQSGAIVRNETMQGKGWVVRRMFADIEADFYLLVDSDGTYDASLAPAMIEAIRADQLAMLVGRRSLEPSGAYRRGHRFGNRLFSGCVAGLFGRRVTDILSGYRVFSRAFVKSFPVFSGGFEIETELTVHALTLRLPIAEIATDYRERPTGSSSKLHTWGDGLQIAWIIFRLLRNEKPLPFFAIPGILCFATSMLLSYPILVTYMKTGLVPRFPTAILATGLALCSLILFACGLILDTVTKGRREMKFLWYLNAGRQPSGESRAAAFKCRDAHYIQE